MRYAIIVGALAALMGCAGSVETRTVNTVAIACDTYAVALEQAVVLLNADKLTDDQIESVNRANAVADALCMPDSPIDPGVTAGMVMNAVEIVKGVLR